MTQLMDIRESDSRRSQENLNHRFSLAVITYSKFVSHNFEAGSQMSINPRP